MSHSKCLQLFPRIFIRPDSARQTSDGKPYTFELPASQLTRLGRRIRKLEQEAETRGDKSTQGQIVVLGDSLLHFSSMSGAKKAIAKSSGCEPFSLRPMLMVMGI